MDTYGIDICNRIGTFLTYPIWIDMKISNLIFTDTKAAKDKCIYPKDIKKGYILDESRITHQELCSRSPITYESYFVKEPLSSKYQNLRRKGIITYDHRLTGVKIWRYYFYPDVSILRCKYILITQSASFYDMKELGSMVVIPNNHSLSWSAQYGYSQPINIEIQSLESPFAAANILMAEFKRKNVWQLLPSGKKKSLNSLKRMTDDTFWQWELKVFWDKIMDDDISGEKKLRYQFFYFSLAKIR